MGSEVDNFPKFWSKHQMQRKKNIESNIQNTKPPRTDDPIIYYVWENILTGFLEGVLEAIQVSSL